MGTFPLFLFSKGFAGSASAPYLPLWVSPATPHPTGDHLPGVYHPSAVTPSAPFTSFPAPQQEKCHIPMEGSSLVSPPSHSHRMVCV